MRLRLSSLGTPRPARVLRGAEGLPALPRGRARAGGPGANRRQPLRAFDSADPGTQAVMADAPKLIDRLGAGGCRALRRGAALLDESGHRLRGRSGARARPRLLHAHGVRVHERRPRRAVGRRRWRSLRRARRAARRAAHAGHRLGRRDRADPARLRPQASPGRGAGHLRRGSEGRTAPSRPSVWRTSGARPPRSSWGRPGAR